MPISYDAARANLYDLWQQHPSWSHAELAAALKCSKSWVAKWLKRFGEELAAGQRLDQVLQGHWRARKTPPPTTHPLVGEQILTIHDQHQKACAVYQVKRRSTCAGSLAHPF